MELGHDKNYQSPMLLSSSHREPWGFGQTTLNHVAREAAGDAPIVDDISTGNQHHPGTNLTGFPSAEDCTIKCRDFLLLRTGETNGCSRWCRVF